MTERRPASVGGAEKGGSGLLSFIHTELTEQIGQEHATGAVWGPLTHTHTLFVVCV